MKKELFPTIILAGGLATRLRPMTEKIPKALIDMDGEPFIAHQIKLLRRNGIRQIIMCVGYLGNMLEEFLGNGSQYDMEVQYSYDGDGEKLLGTAGAIKKALSLLKSDDFFVLYGDSYLPCNYGHVQNYFLTQNKPGLMSVFLNEGKWDTSNVEFVNHAILAYDKMNRTANMHYIDYGLGVFNQSAFKEIPPNEYYDLAKLYQDLLHKKQLAGYEIKQRFYEIGSFAGIEELRYYLAQGTLPLDA
jgi:NDP-sugar pyrophosphorylase family protein